MVRELPGPKLGFWGPLGSGTLPESIGIWSTFLEGSSSILDRSGVADIGGPASGAVRTGVEEGGDGGEGRSGVHLLGHI